MINEFNWSEEFTKDIKSDPISLKSTTEMAFSFLQLNTHNPSFDHFEFFSGIFEACHFKLESHEKGVRFWYCLNEEDKGFPRFFLALEKITVHDENVPENVANISEELTVPNVVVYDRSISRSEDFKDYLKENHFKQPRTTSIKIPKGKVLEFATSFRNLCRRVENSPSFPVGGFCKYVVAFFEKNTAYENFMKANPAYVAYVLGYINDNEHKPNLLRPILAGVGNDGKLILDDFSGEDSKSGSMLQRSTPPPPNS